MFWVNTKRVLKSGFISFFRNGFVSLAAILVMTITLFAVGSLLFSSALLEESLDELRSKVDINVYFVTDAEESDVLAMKKTLEGLAEVEEVVYVSREETLERFKEKHKDSQLTLQALEELDENPFGPSFGIRAKQTSQYESIANFLESDNALSADKRDIIDDINYERNKASIDKLTGIIENSERSNLMKTILLVLVSVLITFNTIRLAIYNSREEIRVMKLVGAGNWYVQGPFVVSGAMYGIVSATAALLLFYPVTQWFGPMFYPFSFLSDVQDIDLLAYYNSGFTDIFLTMFGVGVLLGIVSSAIAVKRYINV